MLGWIYGQNLQGVSSYQKRRILFFVRNYFDFELAKFLKNFFLNISEEFLSFGSYLVIFKLNIKKICIFFVFYRKCFLGSLKSTPDVSSFLYHLSPQVFLQPVSNKKVYFRAFLDAFWMRSCEIAKICTSENLHLLSLVSGSGPSHWES